MQIDQPAAGEAPTAADGSRALSENDAVPMDVDSASAEVAPAEPGAEAPAPPPVEFEVGFDIIYK